MTPAASQELSPSLHRRGCCRTSARRARSLRDRDRPRVVPKLGRPLSERLGGARAATTFGQGSPPAVSRASAPRNSVSACVSPVRWYPSAPGRREARSTRERRPNTQQPCLAWDPVRVRAEP